MKPIPIFGSGVQAHSPAVTAQRRLNCFFDPRPDGDKSDAVIRGTPGTVLWLTLPVAPIRGWTLVAGNLYIVANKNLYKVTPAGSITYLGSITTTSGMVSLADNGVQVIIVDGTFGYTYTIASTVFAKITDVNFPNGCTTVSFINGRFQVEVAGTRQFVTGQPYDGTLWTPYTFGTKENESSVLLAVEVVNGTLQLWGDESVEFWQDVGTTPLPYARVSGTTQAWGLAAVASRAQFMGGEIFLGKNPQGHLQVMAFAPNSYIPTRVSTSDIEDIIDDLPSYTDAIALTYVVNGHVMYQLTFPSGACTLVYDGLSKIWHEAQTGTTLQDRHFGNYGIAFNGENYISDSTTGNIYRLDDNTNTDNGAAIKRQIRTRHIRNGGNVFTVAELYLDIETGMGAQAGQGSDPMMMIQVSKDGGRTFGAERMVSMGPVGQYRSPRLITRRWGQARDFVWQFTVTDPVQFVVISGAVVVAGQEGSSA